MSVEMTVEVAWSFGHRIEGAGECANLHGHNARAVLTFAGEPDARGMVVDFRHAKRVARAWIAENWDHRLVLDANDHVCDDVRDLGLYVVPYPPSTENLVRHLAEALRPALPQLVAVELFETPTCSARWRA